LMCVAILAPVSQRDVEVVRQPLALRASSRRRLEERFGLRFPRVLALLAGAIWWLYSLLPPRSRLRQAIVRRFAQRGLEANNRRDLEAAFMFHASDVEAIYPAQFVSLGLESVIRGLEARMDFQRRWRAEWGEFRFLPEELVDLGDERILVVGRMTGSGLSSGAGVDNDWAYLVTISAGRVTREQVFLDRGQALDAVGLPE
jgi:ketosteroid isomerase-like protein